MPNSGCETGFPASRIRRPQHWWQAKSPERKCYPEVIEEHIREKTKRQCRLVDILDSGFLASGDNLRPNAKMELIPTFNKTV
jgi:hypothetical protein